MYAGTNCLFRISSLVFADLPAPAVKILFDGEGDYVIGEGFDANGIFHYRSPEGILIFETRNNNTRSIIEFMVLKKKARRQSFAVESFLYAPDYNSKKPNEEFCHEQSSENLRDLIDVCRHQIRLRNLTKEEKKQLRNLKSTSPPGTPFKMVYDRGTVRTQSVNDRGLYLTNYPDLLTRTRIINFWGDNETGERSFMALQGDLTDRSFVIENQLPSGGDCRRADPPDLLVALCMGDVRIRPMNESDKPN